MTSSEKRIMRHLLLGWSNHKIANEFGISVETVKKHVSNIMDVIGLSSRIELINHVMCSEILLNQVYEVRAMVPSGLCHCGEIGLYYANRRHFCKDHYL